MCSSDLEGGVIVEPGMYLLDDGTVYQVVLNKAETGSYAKVLVESSTKRITAAGELVDFRFEYAPGGVRRCKPECKMTLEQAKELSIRYGACIRCGTKLEAAKSVEAGIGPVCAKYFA